MTAPAICVVSGNVCDIGGSPTPGVEIIFRPIKLPAVKTGNLIVGSPIRTIPDAYGAFSISMVQGMGATVEIEQAGLKAQIMIPATATANLIDLLPVIP
jgi:hypothetical protein